MFRNDCGRTARETKAPKGRPVNIHAVFATPRCCASLTSFPIGASIRNRRILGPMMLLKIRMNHLEYARLGNVPVRNLAGSASILASRGLLRGFGCEVALTRSCATEKQTTVSCLSAFHSKLSFVPHLRTRVFYLV